MIEVGKQPRECNANDEQTRVIVRGMERNKIFFVDNTEGYLNLTSTNTNVRVSPMPFKKWRVIGMGIFWVVASSAGEDPVIEFGQSSDNDCFGKMSATITGGEKFCVDDHVKYDPLNVLGLEVITETSPTLVTTWTEGICFNVWQTTIRGFRIYEAAVASMTTGAVKPYIIIEVDTGGLW